MNIPTWIKPALIGAGAGAVVLAFVGFSYAGWTTNTAAKDMSKKDVAMAVAAALTPYCVQNSAADPGGAAILAEMKAASVYNRKGIVEKAGWATPLGADKPSGDLAQACQLLLSESL
jgi:hypothetical protein